MVLFGVDVHGVYQAGISFSRLASEGYSYAVIKATEGTNFRPVNFEAWVAATRAAGMIPGGYHFLRAGDGAAQARFFLDRIR
ncbi:MAG TPA: GH25 family lysozyme, partial [Micromonosporaceae bacterium]|nr:GH25 family lysozyme [Micromonosporaceae bacterium]